MLRKISIAAVSLLPASVFAQNVDVTTQATALQTDGLAAIGAIGAVLVTMAGVAVVYKWAKGMIFG
jgi:hypothetical protein